MRTPFQVAVWRCFALLCFTFVILLLLLVQKAAAAATVAAAASRN